MDEPMPDAYAQVVPEFRGISSFLLDTPQLWLEHLPRFLDSFDRFAYSCSHKGAWTSLLTGSPAATLTLSNADDSEATVDHMLGVLTARAAIKHQQPDRPMRTTLAFYLENPLSHPLMVKLLAQENKPAVYITGLDVETADQAMINLLTRPDKQRPFPFPDLQSFSLETAPIRLPPFEELPPNFYELTVKNVVPLTIVNVVPWLTKLRKLTVHWPSNTSNYYQRQWDEPFKFLFEGRRPNPEWVEPPLEVDWRGRPKQRSPYENVKDVNKKDRYIPIDEETKFKLEELHLPDCQLENKLMDIALGGMPNLHTLGVMALGDLADKSAEVWQVKDVTLHRPMPAADASIRKLDKKLQCLPRRIPLPTEKDDERKVKVFATADQVTLDLINLQKVDALASKYVFDIVDTNNKPTLCITAFAHFEHMTTHASVLDAIHPCPRQLGIGNPVQLSSSSLVALKELDRRTAVSNLTGNWQLKAFNKSLPTINGVTRLTLDCDLTDAIISVLNHSFPNVTELLVPGMTIATDYRKANIKWGLKRLTITHRAVHLTHLAALPENMQGETVRMNVPTLVCTIAKEKVTESVLERLANVEIICGDAPVLVPSSHLYEDELPSALAATLRLLEASPVLATSKSKWLYTEVAQEGMPSADLCVASEPLLRLTRVNTNTFEARTPSDHIDDFKDFTRILCEIQPHPILFMNNKMQLTFECLRALAPSQHYESIDGEWKVGVQMPATNVPIVRGVKQMALTTALDDQMLGYLRTVFPDLEQLTVLKVKLNKIYNVCKWLVARLNILDAGAQLEEVVKLPQHAVDGCKTVVSSPDLGVKDFSKEQSALLREPLSHLAFPADTLLTFKDITEEEKPKALASTLTLLHSAGHKTAFVIEHQVPVSREARQSESGSNSSQAGAGEGSQAFNQQPSDGPVMIRIAPSNEHTVTCNSFIGRHKLEPTQCAHVLSGLPQVVLIHHRVLLSAAGIQALARVKPGDPMLTNLNADWAVPSGTDVATLPVVQGVKQMQLHHALTDDVLPVLQHCFPELEQLVADGLVLHTKRSIYPWRVKQFSISKHAVALTHVTRLPQLLGMTKEARTQVILQDILCDVPCRDFKEPGTLVKALGHFQLLRGGKSALVPHPDTRGSISEAAGLRFTCAVIRDIPSLVQLLTELQGWTMTANMVEALEDLPGGGTLAFANCEWPAENQPYRHLLKYVPQDFTCVKLGLNAQGLKPAIIQHAPRGVKATEMKDTRDMIAIKRPLVIVQGAAGEAGAAGAKGAQGSGNVATVVAVGAVAGGGQQEGGPMDCD